MPKIERNIVSRFGCEDDRFPEAVRITDFIEHVRHTTAHFPHNQIGCPDLPVNPFQDVVQKDLMIHPVASSACFRASRLDGQFIEVSE